MSRKAPWAGSIFTRQLHPKPSERQEQVALLGTTVSMDRESSRRTADVNDEFGWGDFWLVKSSDVSIQARYRKVYYPNANQPLNNTYLTSMAVGGPFMRGHRLIVEPRMVTYMS